jgi:hypothetical protein
MRPGRLVLLAIVVLGLGAYIYFFERHAPTTTELAERNDKLFPTMQQEAVDHVTVTNPHGTFEFRKEDGDWKLVAPITDAANQGALSSLLSTLSGLKAERTLKAADVKLADYGLEKPPLAATIAEKGGARFTFRLGNELPLGNTRAAMTGAGSDVFLVSKWIGSDLDKDLTDWRSKELAQVYANDVASLTVKEGAMRVALAHADGTWTLTEPITDLADSTRPQDLLGDISSAQIKEFVDTPGNLETYGLANPRVEITIVRNDKKAPLQLAFGAERKEGKEAKATEVACKRGDRVFWVDGTVLANVSGKLPEWRAKKLVRLDTWAAQKLVLEAGAARAELTRDEGVWKADGHEVEASAVSQRLRDFADLEVVAWDLPKPAAQAVGHVVVDLEDKRKVEATFYPGTTTGEDIAVVPGRTGALGVDAAKVSPVLADPAALAKPKPTPTPEATAAPAATATPAPSAGE